MHLPSTHTSPESAWCSPIVCRNSTDFPEPDPPSTTTDSPRRTDRFTPLSTGLSSKDLYRST